MHLRHADIREQQMQWQRIEKPDYGYAVHVPQDWEERPPNLRNSPWETARFGEPGDRRHSVVMFRQPIRPGRPAPEVAEIAQVSLESVGFVDCRITETAVAGRPGARLDCARHDAGRVWAVSEYFVVRDGIGFCLGCGSSIPDVDAAMFSAMAERRELLALE